VGVGVNPVALPGRELTAFGPPPSIEGMDVRGVAAKLNAEMDTAFEPATAYLNRGPCRPGRLESNTVDASRHVRGP